MPFIWRNKSTAAASQLHPEALACFDAAYLLIAAGAEGFEHSPNLHTVLGLTRPASSMPELLEAFRPEVKPKLEALMQSLAQGHVTPPVMLPLKDDSRTLLARPVMAPSQRQTGVLWLYDVSNEYRQQQRLAQESEKLKSELKHYSTILNMAPYPIWQRDGGMDIKYYNLAYSEIAEESEQDDSPEIDRRERQLAKQALDEGTPKAERRHIIVGGERKFYLINEMPVPQEKMVIGFAQDIGEIEKLQNELEHYISAQGDLLESSASAMAIYGKDMRLKSFNYAFVRLWKLDETWLDTNPLYSEILENLREKRRLPEQANFVQFKQQQLKLFTELLEPHEEFFYLPDGTALRVIAIPHALGGILFAYEDVTDRLALERSYNTLIAVQQETLDNLHEGVAVFGEDGRLKLSNPVYHKMWNVAPDVARTEPHISSLVDHSKHLYIYDDWEAFRTQRIAQIHAREYLLRRLERHDGKVIDCATVPLPDGATLITYLDVTDTTVVERSLRERNEALQEADRLKSEFLANVSYELRSPLTTIGGFAEMLRQEYFGGLTEKQREYVEGIHQSSQHLMQLVNDILDLASIEAGYLQLEVTHFDVHAMMQSVLPLVQERVRELGLEVSLDCPAKIGKLMGDETRIRQVLFKLLSNAIKFSPAGTTITLGAEAPDEKTIRFWVQDKGYGVPAEEQAAIFEKFYKGSNQAVPKSVAKTGTGLGLSVVKNFIDLHGGTVSLESPPGEGTKITCTLLRENPELEQFLVARPGRRKAAPKSATA